MKVSVVFLFLMLLTACTSGEKEAAEVPHGYYFFPRPNIYYDTAEKEFIYFDTVKKAWQTGNLPPVILQSDLGKSMLVDSPPQPVWQGNKEHQLVYSARLYADSSDFIKPPPKPAVAQKTVIDSAAGNEVQEKKKKSRVGELIGRIFGKKKDQN